MRRESRGSFFYGLLAVLLFLGIAGCQSAGSDHWLVNNTLERKGLQDDSSRHRPGRGGVPGDEAGFRAGQDIFLFDAFLAELGELDTPAEQQALVDSFLQAIEDDDTLGFPLVQDSLAVYLYTTSPNSTVKVPGDHNGWDPDASVMTRAGETALFYYRVFYPLDARLDYKFLVGSTWLLDPRNPRQVTGGFGPNSELVMPQWVDPPEILHHDDIDHGELITSSITSSILNNTRTFRVYLPAGYNGNGEYPTLYIHDGGEYLSLASAVNILDYSIAHGICEPLIAVLVNPVNRNDEYWLNDQFIRFMVEEMVPRIDSTYATAQTPQRRGTMGPSLGGLISLALGYYHPGVFGLIGGQSSALWPNNGEIITLYDQAELLPLAVALQVGTFESPLEDNRTLRDILAAKGYPVSLREYHDGHSWGNWRAHMDELLAELLPAETSVP